jgi:hypothetical protein
MAVVLKLSSRTAKRVDRVPSEPPSTSAMLPFFPLTRNLTSTRQANVPASNSMPVERHDDS